MERHQQFRCENVIVMAILASVPFSEVNSSWYSYPSIYSPYQSTDRVHIITNVLQHLVDPISGHRDREPPLSSLRGIIYYEASIPIPISEQKSTALISMHESWWIPQHQTTRRHTLPLNPHLVLYISTTHITKVRYYVHYHSNWARLATGKIQKEKTPLIHHYQIPIRPSQPNPAHSLHFLLTDEHARPEYWMKNKTSNSGGKLHSPHSSLGIISSHLIPSWYSRAEYKNIIFCCAWKIGAWMMT